MPFPGPFSHIHYQREFDLCLRDLFSVTAGEIANEDVYFVQLTSSLRSVCVRSLNGPLMEVMPRRTEPYRKIIFHIIGTVMREGCQLSTEGNGEVGNDWEASFWLEPCRDFISLSQWRQVRAVLNTLSTQEGVLGTANLFYTESCEVVSPHDDDADNEARVYTEYPRMRFNTGPGVSFTLYYRSNIF